MNTTTPYCSHISVPDGFLYTVLLHTRSVLHSDTDCEQAWYNTDGQLLSDGQHHVNNSRHLLVIDENRENLTLSRCIDLHHNVTCHRSGEKFHHFYKVLNETSEEVLEQRFPIEVCVTVLLIAVFLSAVLLIAVLICCCVKQKKTGGVWDKLKCVCWQRSDGSNRSNNTELVMTSLNSTANHLNDDDESAEGAQPPGNHDQNTVPVNMNGCMYGAVKDG